MHREPAVSTTSFHNFRCHTLTSPGERIAQRKGASRLLSRAGISGTREIACNTSKDIPQIKSRRPKDQLCSTSDSRAWINLDLSLDHALLPLPNHTICSALFHNGVILELSCGTSIVSKSRPALPHVPESLRPTQSQLENVHFSWIDRFPLPQLRERLILFSDSLNSEEFLADIFTTSTFTIIPGATSWDACAWHVCQAFKRKWSCLFSPMPGTIES